MGAWILKRKVIVAKTAGFCFGVDRAVQSVYDLTEKGEKVCTLGPIIHNAQMVEKLQKIGVFAVSDPSETPEGATLVIRSHGVARAVVEKAEALGIKVFDATCPFVSKIQQIANRQSLAGDTILIAGDKNHQEVKGIIGHTPGKCAVFADEEELVSLLKNGTLSKDEPITAVAQTTFNEELWKKCQKTLKKVYTNSKIFDTICFATAKRQDEARELSSNCDLMVVVGGRHSSNTKKLADICKENCSRVISVETAAEIPKNFADGAQTIGIVAGASTPAHIIKEVFKTMTENTQATEKDFDEMTFEEALEASLESMNTDQKVKGTVLAVNPTEIQVDIGRKHAGYVPANEYSNDPNADMVNEVKVGDVLDLVIMKTNDSEGTVALSKRRFDSIAGWQKIVDAKDNDEVLESTVADVIKGGITVIYEGVRVFIPASLATLNRGADLTALKGTPIKFKIIELGRGRRAIGSAKPILIEERKAAEEKVWSEIAVGDVIKGTVKSLTGYGAFVDIGGVDGMVHISELSWQRIKHPSEVVSVGDEIEVYIKDLDTEKKKISLGYKKAEDNPWVIFTNKYAVGDVADVKIVSLTSYGAFARIIPGVDGLIHISQIADKHIEKPADELKIGEEVKAKIIDIDFERKRVSLSIRALLEKNDEETETETEAEAETEETTAEETAE